MSKIEEYYKKIDEWAKANPGKATLIVIFFAGLLIGAILF